MSMRKPYSADLAGGVASDEHNIRSVGPDMVSLQIEQSLDVATMEDPKTGPQYMEYIRREMLTKLAYHLADYLEYSTHERHETRETILRATLLIAK